MKTIVLTLCITIAIASAYPAEYNVKNPFHGFTAPLQKTAHIADGGHHPAGTSGSFAGADGKAAPEGISGSYSGVGGSAGSEGLSMTYGGGVQAQGSTGEVKTETASGTQEQAIY